MFSNSHLQEKQADREMIAAAMAEFYARGNEKQVLSPGDRSAANGRQRARQFVIEPVKHELNTAIHRKSRKEMEGKTATPRRLAAIKVAQGVFADKAKAERELLAMKIAAFAGLGDTQREIAAALGISRAHLQRTIKEFKINLKAPA